MDSGVVAKYTVQKSDEEFELAPMKGRARLAYGERTIHFMINRCRRRYKQVAIMRMQEQEKNQRHNSHKTQGGSI